MKITKNIFLFCSLISFIVVSMAADNITMTNAQINNLGIKLGKLEQVKQIPLLFAPAKVVIPPAQEYIVSASLAGLISKLNVAIGDTVKKGQVLAQINSPELLTLQRQLLKANSNLNLGWAAYQRDKKLFDEGVISERRWQETKSRYNSLIAETNAARQLLQIAGMSEDNIKHLAKTRRLGSQLDISSPITGVVLERMAVAGERIDILAPLYRIANLDQLWLEINIPQEQLRDINLQDLVLIANSSATAHISLLAQSVNISNQTVIARAIIDGQNADIRAGQTVNAQIIQTTEKPVYKVPNVAITQREGKFYIYIRTSTGFQIKNVQVLGKEGKYFFITSELNSSNKIALRGAVVLKAKWMGLGEGGDE